MQEVTLKKDLLIGGDLKVNRMGFGSMRITGNGIWGQPEDKDEAIRVLKKTVELGINFIDTADSYGPNVSEELIAEALYPYPSNLVIATKGGFVRSGPNEWQVKADTHHLQKALEGSLKRLKLEQIPLYQLHRIDPNVPAEEVFRFLREKQEEGLIKHIGLSEVNLKDIQKAQNYFDVASVQNKYSLDYRVWEDELQYCQEQDIAFIPWNPINAGNLKVNQTVKEIADKHNASVFQVALSWLLHHSPNILLIPGTSKVKHLEENYKAASIQLTEEEVNAIDKSGS